MTHDPLAMWRRHFPILEKKTYLCSHSLGAMPAQVVHELAEFTDTWAERGVTAWHEGWWEMPISVGDILADIFHAPRGSVSMHQNVSIIEGILLSCYDFSGPRNKIVYTDLNFPSVMYVMEEQKRRGARIEVVPSEDGVTIDQQRLLEAIDEETLLVPVSSVLFRSSYIQDAEAICARAREVGAHVILDIYQAAGCVPVDLQALGVEMAVGGSVKWLMGGPGAGWLYVRPDFAEHLHPAATGWQAHARPFGFETGRIEWGPAAWRFLNGTPHIPALYTARAGYRIVREIGVEAIRAKSQRMTTLLYELATEAGFEPRSPRDPERRGGSFVFSVPESERVAAELIARDFVIDHRPDAGIRVGPHFYNTEDECRALIAEIRRILGR